MEEKVIFDDYDSEPWYYCATCLSPNIQHEDSLDIDCCGSCGSADIACSTLEEWEKMYERRYGHKYTIKTEDPKKSFIYNLSPKELKKKIYESEKWREIIRGIYPTFPGGLSKADSVILFFDTLIKENKISDLKMLLLKMFKF